MGLDSGQPALPIICEFCLARRSPVDGRVLRGCQWCKARTDPNVTCECAFCPWLDNPQTKGQP